MFVDRSDAGRQLAQRLHHLRGQNTVVLGLPRGGVLVAAEVAQALNAPLDVIVVRKLGVPFQPELAMGAISEGGVRVLNKALMRRAGISADELTAVEARERTELTRRHHQYRGGRPRIPLDGRTVVVIDDGIATGATAEAACRSARALGASRVVLATPVAPQGWTREFAGVADELVSLTTPQMFFGIGQWYADFSQISDEEVLACLKRARAGEASSPLDDPPGRDEDVDVPTGTVRLAGRLTVPRDAIGRVVFAHGSGSSRNSPRNRFVATYLNQAGVGTLLLDLLSAEEELDRAHVFDIELLARRLRDTTTWLRDQPSTGTSRIGYFGASTGAGAALLAAAGPHSDIAAVVSRGGRPDLAGDRLSAVSAPTLLIVGGLDEAVLELNRQAQSQLVDGTVAVVPAATHLFEEPGALEQVAELARGWFVRHLAPESTSTP